MSAQGLQQRERRGWPSAWLIALASAGVVAAVLLGPHPLALPDASTGDVALAARVRELLGPRPGTRAVAVALVERDRTRFAGLGHSGNAARPAVDEHSPFEIGSIGKALNGMLLATLAADGIVTPDTRVGDIVKGEPIASSPVGDVTLRELTQHRSGLPRADVGGAIGGVRAVLRQFAGGNPYPAWPPERLMDEAASLSTDGRGSFAYSNTGAAVLGHTLAAAAGMPYPQLLRARVLEPLGMTSTVVAASDAVLPPARVRGTSLIGRPRAPWQGEGFAPAGFVWSTTADLGRLLRALIDGTAPGLEATRPAAPVREGERIGFGWFTTRADGRDVTWHNGGTGGFSSWIGFDAAAGRGVAVLSASDRALDPLGRHLLGAGPPPRQPGRAWPDATGWLQLAVLAFAPFTVIRALKRPQPHRLAAPGTVVDAVGILLVMWAVGPWLDVPSLVWSLAAAITAIAAAWLLHRARDIQAPAPGRARLTFGISATLLTALAAWLILERFQRI
ncbi:MAG TPA: serine hydrolase domain-containing protein [Vicinamibacterales bacterium]